MAEVRRGRRLALAASALTPSALAAGLLLALRAPAQAPSPAAGRLASASWQVHELGLGVTLRRTWCGELLGRPQSLCVLEVDRRQGVHLQLAVPDLLTATSVQARRAGALAAVNGGFFLPDGKPRGLRRLAGAQVAAPSPEPHAAVGWNEAGVRFGGSDEDWATWPEVIEAGPRLVEAGVVVRHGERQRTLRHPRTALGERADGVLVLLTADGRTPPAAGFTLEELGEVMLALGCRSAINLDGGGSTTLWAPGFGGSGIANFPCDDKRFDAAGERAVADVVLVHGRAVVVRDDADAAVVDGAVQHSADGSGFLGAGFLWAPSGAPVEVTFALPVPRAASYEVQRRTVVAAGVDGGRVDCVGEGTRSGFGTSGGRTTDHGEAWERVGSLRADAGAMVQVRVGSVPGASFVCDAIRLVEVAN